MPQTSMVTQGSIVRVAIYVGALAGIALCLLRIQVPLVDSPFLWVDSFDWLANGLAYSGLTKPPGDISHRGMFVTLLLSLLFRLNLIDSALVVGTIFHTLLVVLLLPILATIFTPAIAAWCGLFIFCSFTLLAQSAYVAADVIANFFLSIFAVLFLRFLKAPSKKEIYILSLLAGLGFHAQYIFPIMMPLFLATFFLFITPEQRKASTAILLSRTGVMALMLFFTILTAFFLPRLISFHILYQEKVQHMSLLKVTPEGLAYYTGAFLASYSWWIVGLASVAIVSGSKKTSPYRLQTLFLLGWIVNVIIFFGIFYSWKEIRFLIYAGVPTFILAALGLSHILTKISSKVIRYSFAIITIYFVHATPTNYPWDAATTITPNYAYFFTGAPAGKAKWEIGGELKNWASLPYFYTHFFEVRDARERGETTGFSEIKRNTEIRLALQKAIKLSDGQPLVVYEKLNSYELLIAPNRNKLYALSNVDTTASETTLAGFLREGRPVLFQADLQYEIERLTEQLSLQYGVIDISQESSRYRFAKLSH